MELVRDKRVKDALMNSTIQNMFSRGELRKDHPLQRQPGRWSDSDRDGLIGTVLKDEDIDSIKVCEQLMSSGVILWVIDGLQRLTTLNLYFNNGFKLGKNLEFPIVTYQSAKRDQDGNIIKDEYGNYEYELVEYDLRGKYYNDLPVELKERFNNYKIDMVKHLDCTDEEIGYHIRRYNKQKSMNVSENAVTYMDTIAKEVKRVSLNNKFFKNDIYKEMERNNGTIERIVTESVMCMFHLDKWQKQSKKMGGFLNKNSSKQEFDKLNENLNRLESIYDDNFKKVFTVKDSFIWFTLFDRFTDLNVTDDKFVDFVTEFVNVLSTKTVNGEAFCDIDRKKSTKDKTVIIKKLEILETLMNDFLHIDTGDEVNSENSDDSMTENESFIADVLNMDLNEVSENMDIYNEDLDCLTNKTIRVGSKLLDDANRKSLLAILVYAYEHDVSLEEWMEQYAAKNNMYFPDQRKNFLHMKKDLINYIETKENKEKVSV